MLTPDRTFTILGVSIKEFFLTLHNPNKIALPSKRSGKLIGVTVHNTGDLERVEDDAEQYTRATYNGNMNSVRVHYYVDDLGAWQNLPLGWKSWHAGQNGRADRNGSEAGNNQTISIECIMNGSTGVQNEKAEDNCARLAAYLLWVNDLTVDNLYTHNYWVNVRNGKKGNTDYLNKANDGYKNCPIYIRPHWDSFKAKVSAYMQELSDGVPVVENKAETSFLVKVLDNALNIRKEAGVNSDIVGCIRNKGVYTIVDTLTVNGVEWGKLKSGAGWISLHSKYTKKL